VSEEEVNKGVIGPDDGDFKTVLLQPQIPFGLLSTEPPGAVFELDQRDRPTMQEHQAIRYAGIPRRHPFRHSAAQLLYQEAAAPFEILLSH